MQKMIIAVRLNDKKENSVRFQEVISNYGETIKLRVGLSDDARRGLIMLYAEGERDTVSNLVNELKKVDGLSMSSMETPQ